MTGMVRASTAPYIVSAPSLAIADFYFSAACAEIKARGGVVSREAGPMKHGTTVIAFVRDPDGYAIELIERT